MKNNFIKKLGLLLFVLFFSNCSSSNWAIDLNHELQKNVKPIDGSYYNTAEIIVTSKDGNKEHLSMYVDRTKFVKMQIKMTKSMELFVKEAFEQELKQRGFQLKEGGDKQLFIEISHNLEISQNTKEAIEKPSIILHLKLVANKNVLFQNSYEKEIEPINRGFFRVQATQDALNLAFEKLFLEVFNEKKFISSLLD